MWMNQDKCQKMLFWHTAVFSEDLPNFQLLMGLCLMPIQHHATLTFTPLSSLPSSTPLSLPELKDR